MAKGNAGKMYAVTIEVIFKFRTAQLDGLKTTLKGRLAEDGKFIQASILIF